MANCYQVISGILRQYMGELAEEFLVVELMRTDESYLPLSHDLPDHFSGFVPTTVPEDIHPDDVAPLIENIQEACLLIFGPKKTAEIVEKIEVGVNRRPHASLRN